MGDYVSNLDVISEEKRESSMKKNINTNNISVKDKMS